MSISIVNQALERGTSTRAIFASGNSGGGGPGGGGGGGGGGGVRLQGGLVGLGARRASLDGGGGAPAAARRRGTGGGLLSAIVGGEGGGGGAEAEEARAKQRRALHLARRLELRQFIISKIVFSKRRACEKFMKTLCPKIQSLPQQLLSESDTFRSHRFPETPFEADGEHLEMVSWYSMLTSYNMLDFLLFLKLFVGRFDIRAQQANSQWNPASMGRGGCAAAGAAADATPFFFDHSTGGSDAFQEDGSFVWDFMADCGDGFNSSYAIARLLAQPSLTVEGGRILPRGKPTGF